MKRYINLFTQQASQKKSVVIIRRMKKIGTIVVAILICVLGIEWAGYFYLNAQIASSNTRNESYKRVITQNQSLDKKIALFIYKYQQLQQFIKEDAEVTTYYELLLGLLGNLGGKASVDMFVIKNDQTTEFTLVFPTYEDVIEFLSIMERESFSTYFDILSLDNFVIDRNNSEEYTLQFKGKFKKITDGT